MPCGGCSWQHIAYVEQLRLKTGLVDRLIRSAVPGAPRTRDVRPSTAIGSPWAYRQKVHFAFAPGRDGGSLSMGHFARGTREVVAVRECRVHDEAGNRVAFALREAYSKAGVSAAGGRAGERGRLRAGPPRASPSAWPGRLPS